MLRFVPVTGNTARCRLAADIRPLRPVPSRHDRPWHRCRPRDRGRGVARRGRRPGDRPHQRPLAPATDLPGQPWLVVESLGERHRYPAMPEPPGLTGMMPGTWRMTFRLPMDVARSADVRAWLQLGAVLVPLPSEPALAEPAAPAAEPAAPAAARPNPPLPPSPPLPRCRPPPSRSPRCSRRAASACSSFKRQPARNNCVRPNEPSKRSGPGRPPRRPQPPTSPRASLSSATSSSAAKPTPPQLTATLAERDRLAARCPPARARRGDGPTRTRP